MQQNNKPEVNQLHKTTLTVSYTMLVQDVTDFGSNMLHILKHLFEFRLSENAASTKSDVRKFN